MNDTIVNIVAIVLPIITGMVAWIMNALSNRITKLEDTHSLKVDKEDHIRDLEALKEEMGNLRYDIRELGKTINDLPDRLLNTLQRMGKV
jgi:hypothetical protein